MVTKGGERTFAGVEIGGPLIPKADVGPSGYIQSSLDSRLAVSILRLAYAALCEFWGVAVKAIIHLRSGVSD